MLGAVRAVVGGGGGVGGLKLVGAVRVVAWWGRGVVVEAVWVAASWWGRRGWWGEGGEGAGGSGHL